MTGTIFDIQTYALYDGPGIRTAVYFKGCPLRCYWCHNPESQVKTPEMAWRRDRCARCGACAETCPEKALRVTEAAVMRDRDRCTACGACVAACAREAMERVGYEATVEEVVNQVLRDKPFFDNSGGGVTVTGGEPTAQSAFLLALLDVFRREGIHTAIETCGHYPESLTPALVAVTDLFLFDLKHVDTDAHARGTGVGNTLLVSNFRALIVAAGTKRVTPRIPLIPGFNTTPEAIGAYLACLKDCGYDGAVHLMPYHRWAKAKYERLGRSADFHDSGALDETTLREIAQHFAAGGFEPVCHG